MAEHLFRPCVSCGKRHSNSTQPCPSVAGGSKRFFVAINAELDADNLDEAFKQIADYYGLLAEREEAPTPFVVGRASVWPKGEQRPGGTAEGAI